MASDNTPEIREALIFARRLQSMRVGFEFRGIGPNINGFMVGGDFHVA